MEKADNMIKGFNVSTVLACPWPMAHGIDKKRDKIKNLFSLSDGTIFFRNWTNALVFPWVLYSIFSSNLTVLKTMRYAQFNEFFWFVYLFDVIFSLNIIKEESFLYKSCWLWSKYIRLGLGHFQNLMLAGWVDYFYYKIQKVCYYVQQHGIKALKSAFGENISDFERSWRSCNSNLDAPVLPSSTQ